MVDIGSGSGDRPPLILVVEDETDIRLLTIAAIEGMGFRTLGAGNVREALDQLEDHRDIDVVVTDVRMPGEMDGADLAFTIRSRWPSIGIVVISGYFDPKVSRLPVGTSFLAKPYRTRELQALLDQQLDLERGNLRARRP